MNPGNPLLVAAQAAVVGIATVVVFMTLLSPEGDDDLSGIESPGLPEITQERDRSSPQSARNDRDGSDDRQQPEPEPAPASPAPTEPSLVVPGTAPAPPAGIEDGPAADQYADSVARITAKLY
jgi:hypothetical protein